MTTVVRRRVKTAALLLLALGCSRPLTSSHDGGSSGLGGATGLTGGAGADGAPGAGGASGGGASSGVGATGSGGGGAGPATDGGSDASCVAVCGQVTGVLPDAPGSCTFPLPCARPPGATALIVFLDGQSVPQDSIEGWMYPDGTMSAVRITGHFCAAVIADNPPVDVDFLCEVN